MTALTHSLSSPLSTSSKALVRFKGVDSTSESENDYFSPSEANEKQSNQKMQSF